MKNAETDAPKIGGKIRQLRRQRNLSQMALAKELGISSSYLNLLEHNRRNITVPLLLTLAQKFGLDISDLSDNDEARLSGDLVQVFSDVVFGDLDLTNHDIREFTNSNPAVARAVVHLYDQYRHTREDAAGAETAKPEAQLASELVSDFLQTNGNHFAALEQVAQRINEDVGALPANFDLLASYLLNSFGLNLRVAPLNGGSSAIDEDRALLTISDILPPESRIFELAKRIAEKAAEAEIEKIVDAARLSLESVEDLARAALRSYVAAAVVMPYEAFLEAAEETRYDIDRLAMRFAVSFEQVCHRLTTMQRPGATSLPFHLIRTDIAGNISKRFSISGIQIPRHGGACPRWNVYEAFLQPGRITIQVSEMPDGQQFFCIARTIIKGENRHDASLRYMSIGLGCRLDQAHRLVYSDGINLENPRKIAPVGVSCRVCPRQNCSVRAFPAQVSVTS